MFESARAASGASAVDRCEIITDHGPGEASDLLRGGLGGPGLGLDVLEDCAPSAALLLLVGHNFLDSEGLLATRGAHLPEVETLYVGRWKVGVQVHWFQWEIGLGSPIRGCTVGGCRRFCATPTASVPPSFHFHRHLSLRESKIVFV